MKESLERITTWAAKYLTHDKSYYPVPDTSMPLLAVSTMALPAVQTMAKKDEVVMEDGMENIRPVRQRTRSETTQDKAGYLPPALYSQPKHSNRTFLCGVNTKPATPDDSSTTSPVTETIEQSDHSPGIDELQAVSITFLNRRP